MKDPKKVKAGRKGGRATASRHGKEHMAAIGRKGAESTWKQYYLLPVELANYAMINRETGEVIAIW